MGKVSFSFLFFLMMQVGFAQSILSWQDLADVTFKAEFNEKYGVDFLVPTFGETIQSYHGKQISIIGYFLDLSGDGEILLLSQNPMATCFFCGTAGPETVIEVHFKQKPDFQTDQIVRITGILELNIDDVDHCNYMLKEATGYSKE